VEHCVSLPLYLDHSDDFPVQLVSLVKGGFMLQNVAWQSYSPAT